MANLIAEQSSSSLEFADRAQLAADETRFCIDNIDLITQKDGKVRWYLTICLIEDKRPMSQRLTFDRGSENRDRLFQTIIDAADWPQHNCWVSKAEIGKTGKTFYSLRQEKVSLPCPCKTPYSEEVADLDDHPF